MKRQDITYMALLLSAWVLCMTWVQNARADLLEYVKKAEPGFQWKLQEKKEDPFGLGTIYHLKLVSQVWQDIPWEHDLLVFQPKGVAPVETMMLLVTGGKPNNSALAYGMLVAGKVKAPCAVLYQIPNQPLFDGKKEDALIAETFVRYLATKDENWPLLFPMTKSVIKAMDALQAFSQQEGWRPLNHFIVTGGSKRGWTTWLAAAADARVKAFAPVVIDMLNTSQQLPHQLASFGRYSEEIHDYTSRGLVPVPDTPEAANLWRMVDPYTYRDRLTRPKLIILGNNDAFWTVDALNLYWDGLEGDKWILYVPNAGHKLQQKTDSSDKDPMRAIEGLAAFVRHHTADVPMPKLGWRHETADGKVRWIVQATPAPLSSRLWKATAATRDFRRAKWDESPAASRNGTIVGEVALPEQGYIACYVDLEYAIEGVRYHLCTQVAVATGVER